VSPRVFPKKCPMSIKRERNVVSDGSAFLYRLFIISFMRPLPITKGEFAKFFQTAKPPSGWPSRIGESLVHDF